MTPPFAHVFDDPPNANIVPFGPPLLLRIAGDDSAGFEAEDQGPPSVRSVAPDDGLVRRKSLGDLLPSPVNARRRTEVDDRVVIGDGDGPPPYSIRGSKQSCGAGDAPSITPVGSSRYSFSETCPARGEAPGWELALYALLLVGDSGVAAAVESRRRKRGSSGSAHPENLRDTLEAAEFPAEVRSPALVTALVSFHALRQRSG